MTQENDAGTPTAVILRGVQRFSYVDAFSHLERNHPGCPAKLKKRIARRVSERPWIEAQSLGQAVGIIMQNLVRHERTFYEEALQRASPADYDAIRKKANRRAVKLIQTWAPKPKS